MTEDEAKTKWCPFVRFKFAIASDVTPYNRTNFPRDDENNRCIGSACMAFRWNERLVNEGYCGLAGKP